MSHSIAFIARHAPHGSSAGREGLDAVLAVSAYSEELGFFFLDDGVYQLKRDQDPQAILQNDYAKRFKLLELYDVEALFVCAESLVERGLTLEDLLLEVTPLTHAELRQKLDHYTHQLLF